MSPRVDASMPDPMRRRSTVLTAMTAIAVLLGVVAAGAGSSPVLGKGKRRKAKAASLQLPPIASAPVASASASVAPSVSASVAVAPVPPPVTARLAIGKGTKVLVFGDSMVDAGFAQRLQKLVEARGGSLVHDAWTSSTTSGWSKGERLDNLLALHKPDVVIVALGANEVFLPAPEAVAPRVRAIVQKLGQRACLWVSPPLWKGETGIVGVEKANSAPCGFFDSGGVTVQRAKDGIHPTPKGGSDWADAVFSAVAPEG